MDVINYPTVKTLDLLSGTVIAIATAIIAGLVVHMIKGDINVGRGTKHTLITLIISCVFILSWYTIPGVLSYSNAETLKRQQGCPLALPAYQTAIELNPKLADARAKFLACKISEGELGDLPSILEAQAVTESGSARYWRDLAQVYFLVSDFEKMVTSVQRSSALDPRDTGWIVTLGQSLHGRAELKYAERVLILAVTANPDESYGIYWLAWVQYDLDNLSKALENFDLCLRRFVKGAEIPRCHTGRGLTLAKMGRLAEARLALEQALDIFPDQQDALDALSQLPPSPQAIGTITSINVAHNVTVEGELGMQMIVSFNISNRKDSPSRVNAYFYTRNGEKFTVTNGRFVTAEGQVALTQQVISPFESTQWSDYRLFIPYSAFGLGPGVHDLQFEISLYDPITKQFFASSQRQFFTLTYN